MSILLILLSPGPGCHRSPSSAPPLAVGARIRPPLRRIHALYGRICSWPPSLGGWCGVPACSYGPPPPPRGTALCSPCALGLLGPLVGVRPGVAAPGRCRDCLALCVGSSMSCAGCGRVARAFGHRLRRSFPAWHCGLRAGARRPPLVAALAQGAPPAAAGWGYGRFPWPLAGGPLKRPLIGEDLNVFQTSVPGD